MTSPQLETYGIDSEQPTTCPLPSCGARTELRVEHPDGTQEHECLRCGFAFIGEFDEDEFEYDEDNNEIAPSDGAVHFGADD